MVTKGLASDVTRLWIESDCDRDSVAMAAVKLVEGHKDEIQKFLQQTRSHHYHCHIRLWQQEFTVDLQWNRRQVNKEDIMTSKKIMKFTAVMMSIAWPVMAADMFVFPKNNQTKEQQEQDEFTCYKWAKEQTGFDPNKPMEHAAAPAPQGGAAKGAAKGAAVGAIGGAIGGDAGKGAAIGAGVGAAAGAHKRRKGEKQQAAAEQQAEKQHEANVAGYQRAFGACIEGKGYSVK